MSEGLLASVVLNGLSPTFEAQARAVGAFLTQCGEISVQAYVTLVRDFGEGEKLGRFLGPASERVWLKADYFQPELVSAQVEAFGSQVNLFPPGLFGADLCGRLAARLNGSAVLNLLDIDFSGARPLAKKAAYSQNLVAALALNNKPYCLALSKDWSSKPHKFGDKVGAAGKDVFATLAMGSFDKNRERSEIPRETSFDLSKAQALVVSGHGLGDKAAVESAAELAQKLSADWGVSRPVAMNAWAPLERLIGVSGAMAAPKWALCLGASGAAALLSGLSQAQKIMAVNLDPEAPIMSRSDLAIAGEAKEIILALKKLLDQ
ncbi:MAG: FAD-binding protein [Deltaproteobacteria bacterium]|nr:FAD-binding protein [Deltaproteobacteria bacterium]